MASSQATWLKNTILIGTTFVAGVTLSELGVVSFTTGNTYQDGTHEATVLSGATVTAGGGAQSFGVNGGRFATLEFDTASGTNAAGVLKATTVSGATVIANSTRLKTVSGSSLTNTSGLWTVNNSGVEEAFSMSGATIQAGSFTGSLLSIHGRGTGSGKIRIFGPEGAHICYRDTDNAGWTQCDALDGTVSCRVASDGQCP